MNLESIKKLEEQFNEEFSSVANQQKLEELRVKFIGRNGLLTGILRSLKDAPIEVKREVGPRANELRKEWDNQLRAKAHELTFAKEIVRAIDISRPGHKIALGHEHPLTQVLRHVVQIFTSLGFSVADGPDIESEYYNFDALNLPPGHPARDMWSTFWLKQPASGLFARPDLRNKSGVGLKSEEKLLLRTHTSPVQIRYMETHRPPLKIISPGAAFRFEATDPTHAFQFWQLEGLMVGDTINLGHLKYIIETFLSQFFGKKVKARFEPSYFPFVEPGLQFSMSCPFCNAKGCASCQKAGWVEMGGAGMVHPQVFRNVGYDAQKVSGFAFGLGLDRLAMHKYHIPDIRMFYSGDLRFTRQF